MPDVNLLLYFQEKLKIERQWWLNGKTYAQTCEVCVLLYFIIHVFLQSSSLNNIRGMARTDYFPSFFLT